MDQFLELKLPSLRYFAVHRIGGSCAISFRSRLAPRAGWLSAVPILVPSRSTNLITDSFKLGRSDRSRRIKDIRENGAISLINYGCGDSEIFVSSIDLVVDIGLRPVETPKLAVPVLLPPRVRTARISEIRPRVVSATIT